MSLNEVKLCPTCGRARCTWHLNGTCSIGESAPRPVGPTLIRALAQHHGAGRIACPWLPGMVVHWRYNNGPPEHGRIRSVRRGDGSLFAWRLLVGYDGPAEGSESVFVGSINYALTKIDVTDAATVGCLAALARGASGNPTLFCSYSVVRGEGMYSIENHARQGQPPGFYELTEGDAWAAYIVALT